MIPKGQKNIAIALDDNYIQHCFVMLESLRSQSPGEINIHVVYAELSSANITALLSHFRDSEFHFHFYSVADCDFSFLAIRPNDHVSVATYFRILLPNILLNLHRVVFLDLDIIINGTIDTLFELPIDDLPLLAVEDISIQVPKKVDLGMLPENTYFNAGVLVMNLDYFRTHNLVEKALTFIREYPEKCEYWDQDALNAVVLGRIGKLPNKYNVQSSFFSNGEAVRDIANATLNPAIIHFTGSGYCKPWFYYNSHPFKALYYKFLANTPYKGYKQPDKPAKVTIYKNFLKKRIRDMVKGLLLPLETADS